MNLLDVLRNFDIKENKHQDYEIETPIGTLLLGLNSKHLWTNFYGYEEKAKLIFGHWKNNTYIDDEQDVKSFIKGLFNKIESYKLALSNGDFNYK